MIIINDAVEYFIITLFKDHVHKMTWIFDNKIYECYFESLDVCVSAIRHTNVKEYTVTFKFIKNEISSKKIDEGYFFTIKVFKQICHCRNYLRLA